jgi:predicted DNA binding CopG/RHH family protein
MTKKHIDIENHEDEILKDLESDEFFPVPDHEKINEQAKQAANNHIKRDSRINIRVSTADLNLVRKIAAEEGLPYQTLLASVIHKFAVGRLVDINSKLK